MGLAIVWILLPNHITSLYLSVKSPKENEWILDPVVIADVYGPEVQSFVLGLSGF